VGGWHNKNMQKKENNMNHKDTNLQNIEDLNYIEFLELLTQFQENIILRPNDKTEDLWKIIKCKYINLEKNFQRLPVTKIILKTLEKFKHREDFLYILTADGI
jgi:hypothetical protein